MGETAGGTLRRGRERILAGVCSGLAEYFHVDPFFVRVGFVVLTVLPPGIGFFLYLALWFLMPPSDGTGVGAGEQFGARLRAMGADLRGMGEQVRSGFRQVRPAPEGSAPAGGASAPPPSEASPAPPGTPPAAAPPPTPPPPWPAWGDRGRPRGYWAGLLLILLGAYLLVINLGLLSWWRWDIAWPVLFILGGILLLVRRYS